MHPFSPPLLSQHDHLLSAKVIAAAAASREIGVMGLGEYVERHLASRSWRRDLEPLRDLLEQLGDDHLRYEWSPGHESRRPEGYVFSDQLQFDASLRALLSDYPRRAAETTEPGGFALVVACNTPLGLDKLQHFAVFLFVEHEGWRWYDVGAVLEGSHALPIAVDVGQYLLTLRSRDVASYQTCRIVALFDIEAQEPPRGGHVLSPSMTADDALPRLWDACTRGLANTGNTCYCNAVVTMFLRTYTPIIQGVANICQESLKLFGPETDHVDELPRVFDDDSEFASHEASSRLVRSSPKSWVPAARRRPCLTLHRELRLVSMLVRTRDAAGPRPNYVTIRMLQRLLSKQGFFDGYQHDAHEFFTALLSAADDECDSLVSIAAITNSPDQSDAGTLHWVNRIVCGRVQSQFRCAAAACRFAFATLERTMIWSVPVPRGSRAEVKSRYDDERPSALSVQQLFDQSLQETVVEDFHCERCSSRTVGATHRSWFVAAPEVLFLHVKRFYVERDVSGRHGSVKNGLPVDISGPLTVKVYPPSDAGDVSLPSEDVVYFLQSVTHHHGRDMEFGHYTTTYAPALYPGRGRVDYPRQWYDANDERLEPTSLEPQSRTAYLLQYVRV